MIDEKEPQPTVELTISKDTEKQLYTLLDAALSDGIGQFLETDARYADNPFLRGRAANLVDGLFAIGDGLQDVARAIRAAAGLEEEERESAGLYSKPKRPKFEVDTDDMDPLGLSQKKGGRRGFTN